MTLWRAIRRDRSRQWAEAVVHRQGGSSLVLVDAMVARYGSTGATTVALACADQVPRTALVHSGSRSRSGAGSSPF